MSALRTAIIEVLSYRDPDTARAWAESYKPSQDTLAMVMELPEANLFIFNLFKRLPRMPEREVACLSGNFTNPDHWLRDFANVVAPTLVENKALLFTPSEVPAPKGNWLADLI